MCPTPKSEIASFDKLNTWYYSDAPKTVRPMLDIIRRKSTFEEVQGGLDETNALFEARRCLSCGNCFECDNCYGVCPDNAVIKHGPGKGFDFNLRLLQGLRHLRRRMPLWRDQDGARRYLTLGQGQALPRVPVNAAGTALTPWSIAECRVPIRAWSSARLVAWKTPNPLIAAGLHSGSA